MQRGVILTLAVMATAFCGMLYLVGLNAEL